MACDELVIKDIARIETNVKSLEKEVDRINLEFKQVLQDLKNHTIAVNRSTDSITSLTIELKNMAERHERHYEKNVKALSEVKAEAIVNYKENLKRIEEHKEAHTCEDGFDQKLRAVCECVNKIRGVFGLAWHNILNTVSSFLTLAILTYLATNGIPKWMITNLK